MFDDSWDCRRTSAWLSVSIGWITKGLDDKVRTPEVHR
jgi:hypothetical protein